MFSASETSITVASSAKLSKLKSDGNKKAGIVLDLKKKKEQVISSILLGNNLANILSSSIFTFIAIEFFGPFGILVSTILMTFVILVFAEILPKMCAIKYPENSAMRLSIFVKVFLKIFYPVVKYINNFISHAINRFCPNPKEQSKMSASDIVRGMMIASAYDTNTYHSEQNIKKSLEVIGNVLEIAEIHIDKIMTHRRDFFCLDVNLSAKEIINAALASNYSKIPIWRQKKENIVFVLDAKKMKADAKNHFDLEVKNYLKIPTFAPETTLVSVQLHNFRAEKKDFAMVIDEYGNVIGLVTISDILEEILGGKVYKDAQDAKQNIAKLSDGSFVVSGKISVRDLNRQINCNFSTQSNQTFAGMIIDEVERIPEEGEIFDINGFCIEILKNRNNMLVLVRIYKKEKTLLY